MASDTGPRGAQLPQHSMFANDLIVGRTVGHSSDPQPPPGADMSLRPATDASPTMMSMSPPSTPGPWEAGADAGSDSD